MEKTSCLVIAGRKPTKPRKSYSDVLNTCMDLSLWIFCFLSRQRCFKKPRFRFWLSAVSLAFAFCALLLGKLLSPLKEVDFN